MAGLDDPRGSLRFSMAVDIILKYVRFFAFDLLASLVLVVLIFVAALGLTFWIFGATAAFVSDIFL